MKRRIFRGLSVTVLALTLLLWSVSLVSVGAFYFQQSQWCLAGGRLFLFFSPWADDVFCSPKPIPRDRPGQNSGIFPIDDEAFLIKNFVQFELLAVLYAGTSFDAEELNRTFYRFEGKPPLVRWAIAKPSQLISSNFWGHDRWGFHTPKFPRKVDDKGVYGWYSWDDFKTRSKRFHDPYELAVYKVEIPLGWCLLIALMLAIPIYIRTRPPPSGYCQECGYNLSENRSGLCPECGAPFNIDRRSVR